MNYITSLISKGIYFKNYLGSVDYLLVYKVKEELYVQEISEEDYVLFKDIFNRIEELLFIIKN